MKLLILFVTYMLVWLVPPSQAQQKYAAVTISNTYYYQLIDTQGHLLLDSILQPRPSEVYGWRYDEGIFRYAHEGKIGYKNLENKIVLPAEYDEVSDFVNGAGIVTSSKGVGVINSKGDWVIEPVYNYIEHADSNGLLIVRDMTGHIGLMTVRGDTVLKPCYLTYQHDLPKFSEGLLAVGSRADRSGIPLGIGKDDVRSVRIGFINTKGKLVIDTVWQIDYSTNDYYRFEGGISLASKEGKNVAISRKSHVLYSLPDTLERFYNCGGLMTCNDVLAHHGRDMESYFIINRKGRIAYRSPYPNEHNFRDGYLIIKRNDTCYQFLDGMGRLAFGGRTFRYASDFSFQYAEVSIQKDARLINGLIDTRGRFRYVDSAAMGYHILSDNGWLIFWKKSNAGFVDVDNHVRIPPVHTGLHRFWNGYCPYVNEEHKEGFIDEHNDIKVPAGYADVMDFQVLRVR